MEHFFSFALALSLFYTSTLTSSTPIFNLSTDEHALLAFKNALTSNSHLVLNTNWTSNVPICSWIGVSCGTKHLRVTALNVSGYHLMGTIAPHLANLTFLHSLDISSNGFTGFIPSWLGSLPRLRDLYLNNNTFSGKIPSFIFNFSSLAYMDLSKNSLSGGIDSKTFHNTVNLQKLDLSDNDLIGCVPKAVGNLTFLEHLGLDGNNFTGTLPQELGNLVHLKFLNVRDNSLSGFIPSSIFNLSALNYLDLAYNQFSGTIPPNIGNKFPLYNLQHIYLEGNGLSGKIPSCITNASELIVLCVQNNSFSGPMPNFGNLKFLQRLYVAGNRFTGAESPAHELGFLSSLNNCRQLERLEISENPLNGILPTSIGNLSTSLRYFYSHDCDIKGAIPSGIGNLSSLIDLKLYGNHMTGFVPRRLIGNLQKLQGLDISYNQLQGDISRDLCRMNNLETLDLSGNMFTGSIPDCLGEVKSLRNIHLKSNKLNSTIPSNLWNLRDLLVLDLSLNYLGGQLSSQIENLKVVYQLDLSSNQLLGDIPTTIDGCGSLEFLSLSNNKLNGSIPNSLGNVRGLTTLDLSSNNLSGLIPKSLEGLKFLQYFNVSYNKFEGEIPSGIVNSTAELFMYNSGLCGAAKFEVSPCSVNHGRSMTLIFFKYIVPSSVAATIMVVFTLMLIRRRKQIIISPTVNTSLGNLVKRKFSYVELVQGTNSFSQMNLLGIGSFGSVYRATLSDGLSIAVKVFNLQLEGATKSFDTESEILSSIRHRNLLPVIGCSTNQEFRALILKYMPNGSLEKWLHSDNNALDLVQRLNIATDVALALEYLHHGHTFPVVHCDIKPSNVLLDEDMTAHVGDFGISKLFDEGEVMSYTTTLATIGYAAPEYGSKGKVSTAGDVYSYGILLLEMFTQKKPTDAMFSDEMSLKDWVNRALSNSSVSEIMAHGLVSGEDQQDLSTVEECMSSIFDMAMKCLAFSPNERIDMIQVGGLLHKIKAKVTSSSRDQ